jgi:hypothetical protein
MCPTLLVTISLVWTAVFLVSDLHAMQAIELQNSASIHKPTHCMLRSVVAGLHIDLLAAGHLVVVGLRIIEHVRHAGVPRR